MMKLLLSSLFLLSTFFLHGEIRWLEEIHNFGAFNENDGAVSCRLKFINDTDTPVLIRQVHVTCGCTTPSFDKSPVEPGDTGTITVTYDPNGRPGRFEKKIIVELNTTPSRYTLYIKGSVVGTPSTLSARFPAVAGPLRLRTPSVPFGEVSKGKSRSYFLEIYNASTDTLRPVWENLPAYISVGSSRTEIFPGEDLAYTFLLSSNKINEWGLVTDSLILIPDSSKPDQRIEIPTMVMIKEDFTTLTPTQRRDAPIIASEESFLDFGNIKHDSEPVTKTLSVHNRGKESLILRRVYSADQGIYISVEDSKIKKGKKGDIKVTVNPAEIEGDLLNARLIIISNDPSESTLPVRIVGQLE